MQQQTTLVQPDRTSAVILLALVANKAHSVMASSHLCFLSAAELVHPLTLMQYLPTGKHPAAVAVKSLPAGLLPAQFHTGRAANLRQSLTHSLTYSLTH